jgi:hypothetical protein
MEIAFHIGEAFGHQPSVFEQTVHRDLGQGLFATLALAIPSPPRVRVYGPAPARCQPRAGRLVSDYFCNSTPAA